MPVEIVAYEATHIPAVRAFNARLKAAGIPHVFPESNVPSIPRVPGSGLYREHFLAVDGGEVRGGYLLKHQDFVLKGETISIGNFGLPLSEGTIDRRYALVASQLLLHALRRQPHLYGLGIGSYEAAAAHLLQSARFSVVTVPFYYRVEHAAQFLRKARVLRTSRLRRLACDVGAATGVGAVGIGLLQRYHTSRARIRPVDAASFDTFGPAADSVWAAGGDSIMLGAVRDQAVLARLYDVPGNRFIKVQIDVAGEPYGWAVCLATRMSKAKYFGDLKVGSIVDCLSRSGHERALIGAAVDRLRQEDVDLIVTNQSLGRVGDALRAAGFLGGPSNFLFAASPKLAERIQPLETNLARIHLTRGDGDGPINL